MTNWKRWQSLWRACAHGEGRVVYDLLISHYNEAHRHYHTLSHIQACLDHFDTVRDQADQPIALECAIWFHDVIYRIRATNNEKASAEIAQKALLCGGAPLDLAERVTQLILATEHDQPLSGVPDDTWMVDIDLAILGQPRPVYRQFEYNIRREYTLVPWFLYRRKRRQLLQGFLDRPSIYHSKHFQTQLETQARENLLWACKTLQSGKRLESTER